MSVWPQQFEVYKGITGKYGAVKFSMQRAHFQVDSNSKLKNFDGRFIKDSWKQKSPSLTESNLVPKEGTIFMDITSAKGKNVYDWDRKIVFAFNLFDVSKVVQWLEGNGQEPLKLMHDPGAGSASKGKVQKYITFDSPKGFAMGCQIKASQRVAGGENIYHVVPISPHEMVALRELFKAFIPACLAWR